MKKKSSFTSNVSYCATHISQRGERIYEHIHVLHHRTTTTMVKRAQKLNIRKLEKKDRQQANKLLHLMCHAEFEWFFFFLYFIPTINGYKQRNKRNFIAIFSSTSVSLFFFLFKAKRNTKGQRPQLLLRAKNFVKVFIYSKKRVMQPSCKLLINFSTKDCKYVPRKRTNERYMKA